MSRKQWLRTTMLPNQSQRNQSWLKWKMTPSRQKKVGGCRKHKCCLKLDLSLLVHLAQHFGFRHNLIHDHVHLILQHDKHFLRHHHPLQEKADGARRLLGHRPWRAEHRHLLLRQHQL